MIKLKSLIREDIVRSQPNRSLGLYILKNCRKKYAGTVYHGTPLDGLTSMLTTGIGGGQHGELAEYEAFSTSVNPEALHMFSETKGYNGLEFKVSGINLVVLDQFLTKLMTEQPGSGMDADVEDEDAFREFCKYHGVPWGSYGRDVFYLPYNYMSSLGVDAMCYDYVWRRIDRGIPPEPRDESEIAFIGRGIKKLNRMVDRIWIDSQEYEMSEKNEALAAIEEYT